ncbi:MAG: AAA family ATPase, partial [Rhodothermales bacterium]|nr:AAA family ATPase [Rhodothermales bacterium]
MADDNRDKLNLDRGDSSGKGPKLPDRRPKFMLWIYLAAFMALMVHIFLFMGGVETNDIEYSTFLRYIEQGYVEEIVVVNDAEVEGKYTSEAVREGHVQVVEQQPNILTGDDPEQRNAFSTTKPSDHELIQYILEYNDRMEEEGGRTVSFDADRQENWFGGLLTWIIPLAIIIALWVFL